MPTIFGLSHLCSKFLCFDYLLSLVTLFHHVHFSEAASKSRVEVCSLLLSEGADPSLLNCHNKSAIDSAPTRELQERIACKFLLKKCIDFIYNMLF